MQKKDLAIGIALICYGLLFHNQNPGINFLLFSVLITTLYCVAEPLQLRNKTFCLYALLSLVSGFCVFLYGSTLSVWANCVSVILLSSAAASANSAVIIQLISGIYSVVGSPVFAIRGLLRKKRSPAADDNSRITRLLIYLGSALLVLIFLAIYRNVNPLFKKYTELISLDFISVEWVLFTVCGFPLVYAFFRNRRIVALDTWEKRQVFLLTEDREVKFNENLRKAMIFLFVALNLMLVVINALDVGYLYLGHGLPEGVTHKQFVHQGVGMLMFSILLGICLILVAFSGSLNFERDKPALRLLVNAWLIQNVFMVFSTAIRNHLYIQEALLTYKRIGVYYWLFFAVLALITTLLKIRHKHSTWKFFRTNTFLACLVFITSACADWDSIIGSYNASKVKFLASLDKKYLLDLSEANLFLLYTLKNEPGFEVDSTYHYDYWYKYPNKQALDRKLYYFLEKTNGKDWRSFNFRTNQILSDIRQLDLQGAIDTVDLLTCYDPDLRVFATMKHIRVLKLSSYTEQKDTIVKHVNVLKSVETLYLSGWNNTDTASLRRFKNLKTLYYNFSGSKNDSLDLLAKNLPYTLVVL